MTAPAVVPRKEKGIAAALLLALLSIVHYDVVFLGRSFVLTNHYNPLDYRSLPQNYGADMVAVETWTSRNLYSYANIKDAGGPWWQWEPDGEFLRTAMRTGEWPFWDPYVGAGTPAMANMTPGYFFPPYTVLVALGASVPLKNAYFLLQLWCAGFFTWLLLRTHGLGFVSALFGGTAVVMSGGLNQHIGTIALQTAACMPVALYVTRRFLDHPTGGRAVLLAVVYASTALASFPPILMWLFGITALYALVSIWLGFPERRASDRVPLVLRWAAATAVSVGLVGFFYVPALTLRESVPYVVTFYEGAGLESMPIVRLFQLLSPTLAGGVRIYLTPPVPVGNEPNLPYVGIVVILLALVANPTAALRVRVLFYTSVVAAALILMKVFGIPPVQWIARLPLFNQIHYAAYFGMSLSYLAAFLAAIGLDNVLSGSTGARRVIAAVGISLGCVESLWWIAEHAEVLKSTADVYLASGLACSACRGPHGGGLASGCFLSHDAQAGGRSLARAHPRSGGCVQQLVPKPRFVGHLRAPRAVRGSPQTRRRHEAGHAVRCAEREPEFAIRDFQLRLVDDDQSAPGVRTLPAVRGAAALALPPGGNAHPSGAGTWTAPASGSSRFETRFRTSCSRRNPVDTQRGSRMATCGYSNAQRRLVSSFPVSIGCFARRLS